MTVFQFSVFQSSVCWVRMSQEFLRALRHADAFALQTELL
jgi:hypothetical protein